MKKLPIIVASALATVGLIGGVATAFAAINTSSTSDSATVRVDDAIYLHWGTNQIGAVTDLSTPVVRQVIVAAPTGNQTTGTVTVNFALEKTNGANDTVVGVKVGISTVPYSSESVQPNYTLEGAASKVEKSYDHTVSALKTADAPYYLKISLDETTYNAYVAEHAGAVIAGTLTATLTFTA